MTVDQSVKVQLFIQQQTGLRVDVRAYEDDRPVVIEREIKPSECGPLAPMFKHVDMAITITPFDYTSDGGMKGVRVSFKYNYKHPAGGNGYTTTFVSVDNYDTFQFYN